MKARKNPKYNLENKKGLFFSIGLCASLALVSMAFEYKVVETPMVIQEPRDIFEDVIFEVQQTKFPEPPKPKRRQAVIVQPTVAATVSELQDLKTIFEPQKEDETVGFIEGEEDGIELPIELIEDPLISCPVGWVEEMPEPVGGMKEFFDYLKKNLKYPSSARRSDINGRVFVEFVVTKKGEIEDIKTIKGIGYGCDEEAIRAILGYQPGWKPGKQGFKKVAVKMVMPIFFQLNQ